jgi:hypothetical protein
MFGGNLPAGTIHLRIKAPEHMDFDTTAHWPSAAELQVKLKRRSGPPTTPQCEVAASRPRTNLSRVAEPAIAIAAVREVSVHPRR